MLQAEHWWQWFNIIMLNDIENISRHQAGRALCTAAGARFVHASRQRDKVFPIQVAAFMGFLPVLAPSFPPRGSGRH